MTSRTCGLLLSVAALLSACGTPAPRHEVARIADAVVDDAVARYGFSGAVVLMRDGKTVYERAVGLARRDPDLPFTLDTPADGASLAKTLTAAAAWTLVTQGRLALDEPVVTLVPDYPHATTTLRDLLTHRNGLPDYEALDDAFAPGQVRGTQDLVRELARRQGAPEFAPGVRVEYSNIAFDVAALMVERASGKPIEVWLRDQYFDRLGMQSTFARPPRLQDWPGPRTLGYRKKGADWVLFDVFDGEGFIGASNIYASARDWARWGNAFAAGEAMPPQMLDTALRMPTLDSGLAYRLNLLSWYCADGEQRCQYTGDLKGFFSQVYWDRERRETVVFVANSTLPPWQRALLTRDLIDALAGRVPATPRDFTLVRVEKQNLAGVAGSYMAAQLGVLNIDVRDDRAFVRVGDGERSSLYAVTREVFYAPMLDLWFAFSGTPEPNRLHIRSVFLVADARRLGAPAGTP